jgi:hypothetical protein
MLTPVQSVSFNFTSDDSSEAIIVDLSAPRFGLNLQGSQPVGVQSLTVTNTGAGGGAVVPASVTLVGWVLTITFSAALPTLDTNSKLIQYAVAFLLQVSSILAP